MGNELDLGWIKLHRKVLYSGIMQYPLAFTLFAWCMVKAATKKTKTGMNYQSAVIQPGQLIVGRQMIARELNQTEQKIRTALLYLKNQGIITSKTTNKFSVITIVNWGEYQFVQEESTGNLTSIQPADNQQITTYKEVKNKELRKETYSAGFEAFWTLYPRKVAKGTAAKAYTTAFKIATEETILAGLKKQLAANRFSKEEKYIPHAATWLNGRRWEDQDGGNVRRGDGGTILPAGI